VGMFEARQQSYLSLKLSNLGFDGVRSVIRMVNCFQPGPATAEDAPTFPQGEIASRWGPGQPGKLSNEQFTDPWDKGSFEGSLLEGRWPPEGPCRNRQPFELGQWVVLAPTPMGDLPPGYGLKGSRGTRGVKDADVGVEAYGHDAGDGRAHLGSPRKKAWPYPLRNPEVLTWREVVRPHARHGTATWRPTFQGRTMRQGR